ncbi:MAG: transglutaminase domain-containing protein [Oscillospiraceae bacterium]|nr:transglutaminase domain-containing protein [Oscillospiraceae bacterium]
MQSSGIYNRIKLILATGIAIVLSACSREGVPDTGDVSYTIISGGTAVTTEAPTETEDIYADVSDTKLYIPEHMVTKYASLDYDKRMQDVYDDVVDTMQNFRTKSYVPLTISTEDYVKVLETVRCEQLMLFYLQNRYAGDFDSTVQTYEMNFSYKYSIKEVNIMLMETEKAAKEIMTLTDPSMSDYEKLKIFHDYLVLNVESSTDDPTADSIYGALVNKKALCEGYAKAFSYLCNLAGIENMIVTGYTDVDHMWNMVKLEGKWYHIDVGWDKPSAALSERYPDMVLYQYFLSEDSIMENNRIISNMLCDPPVADSSDMYYFNVENKYAETYDQALEIIEQSCRRCIDSGEKYFMIKLDSSNLYLQTTSDLIKPDSEGVTDIDRIVRSLNFKGQISYIDYYKAYRIIIFVLE